MKKYILLLPCFLLYGCAINLDFGSAEEDPKPEVDKAKLNLEKIKIPNDIRWVTKSSEYKILCEQTYKNAWDNLSEILNQSNQQSAIIMDLDETVLDNSKYQIGLTEKGESYNPESWSEWVNLKEAELVPGAKQFIDNVRLTNTTIIFLSNRMAKNELPTIENMKRLNIYDEKDIFLLRIDKPDKKHVRRNEVTSGTGRLEQVGPMEVLAYFGDAFHDFPQESENYIFGQNMFMFPNPMYGKW
jgi:5'-nucleotidase (lipoprotein e(P4) family)